MSPLDELVEAYAALEERAHRLIASLSGPLCAACAEPCCRPAFCAGVLESAWLRRVAASRGRPSLPAVGEDCDFLGPRGCRLPAGRPMECTWYVCDAIERQLPGDLDRFVYKVYSSLLGFVARGVSRDRDLTDIEDPGSLSPRQRQVLVERMELARRCADAGERLLAGAAGRERDADFLLLASTFPYAARSATSVGRKTKKPRRKKE